MVRKFDILNYTLLFILMAMFAFPFLYVFFLSISDSFAISSGAFVFLPVNANLDAYSMVFRNAQIWLGYFNSVLYSVSGTLLTLIVCSLPAYVLSTHEFKPKRLFTVFFAITMFFSGGIIPTFLVIRELGLLDTVWSIIIIPALSAWNIILFRTNFKQVPESLIESAKIDGAGHFWIYSRLIMPLSKPIIAMLAIYAFVGIWNSYFPALLYLTSPEKQPLMIVLRRYVVAGTLRGPFESLMSTINKPINGGGFERQIKMATIMISVLPVIMLYPFMQKYLGKGIMIGAIKE
jgi:putative aldouronate transport system permease protein